jgi:hypothetical protein
MRFKLKSFGSNCIFTHEKFGPVSQRFVASQSIILNARNVRPIIWVLGEDVRSDECSIHLSSLNY